MSDKYITVICDGSLPIKFSGSEKLLQLLYYRIFARRKLLDGKNTIFSSRLVCETVNEMNEETLTIRYKNLL